MTSESACARTSALSDSALASLTSCWSSHPRIGRPRACTRCSSGARFSACRRGAAKAGARPHFATTCVRPFWSGRNRARSPRSTTIQRRRARPQASIEERASVEVQSVAGRSECDRCGQVSILRPTGLTAWPTQPTRSTGSCEPHAAISGCVSTRLPTLSSYATRVAFPVVRLSRSRRCGPMRSVLHVDGPSNRWLSRTFRPRQLLRSQRGALARARSHARRG